VLHAVDDTPSQIVSRCSKHNAVRLELKSLANRIGWNAMVDCRATFAANRKEIHLRTN